MRKMSGFTVIELLVTVAVLAVIIRWSLPSFERLAEKLRLIRATEPVYERLVYAHSEAIKRFSPMVVSFSANNTEAWGFGVTDGRRNDAARGSCVPSQGTATQEDACTIDFDTQSATTGDRTPVLRTLSADHPRVVMRGQPEDGDAIVCTGGAANVRFDVPSGTAVGIDDNCAAVLATPHFETRVRVGSSGHIWICSPTGPSKVSWYPDC